MNIDISSKIILTISLLIFMGCGSSAIVSTPVENIDTTPLKVSELTEIEQKTWSHLDLIKDTIPGMSVHKAYTELIKNKKGKTIIVAVIDSGIDIDHEDLNDVIWTNKNEIPNNGKDDDNNGYIDDIHGWNFLGEARFEQLEYVRLLVSGDRNNPRYSEALSEYNETNQKYLNLKAQYEQLINEVNVADKIVSKHLKKKGYTITEVNAIKTENKALQESVALIQFIFRSDFETIAVAMTAFENDLTKITNRLNYHLNKTFKGRQTDDDINDLTDVGYGNGNVKPIDKSENHGTHVAGIIAAERNNSKGVKGVANNVKIMAIRNTPSGDEYDKDVALAIRYAVDNGAKIINMSFGKYYSPHSDWVRDAIAYAGDKDVLIIHGAGNESLNLDLKNSFPNDQLNSDVEVSDNFLSVGAITQKYGSGLIAKYSNYGKINVDVFAPGSAIHSTFPENSYETIQGTSMAAPAVAGIAALIRSQYPKLTASEVKQIIMESGVSINTKLVVAGDSNTIKELHQISKSGKIVNAYNALIQASLIARQ
ncbi:peptidase S8 [Flavobacteriales bacterium 33_180_T64]|nr:peptidase S8 [Flavobacteriales bacterium 33_180_T64]